MDGNSAISLFVEFFNEVCGDAIQIDISKGKTFTHVDFGQLAKFSPELAQELVKNPEEIIAAASAAISGRYDLNPLGTDYFDGGRSGYKKKFYVRFTNLPDESRIRIRDVRYKHLGSLVRVSGILNQTSDIIHRISAIRFECPSCGSIISVIQTTDKIQEPGKCSCGRKGKFAKLQVFYDDVQKITVQEEIESLEGNEQPRKVFVELRDDLCSRELFNILAEGNRVEITGVVKPFAKKQDSTEHSVVIDANSIISLTEDFSSVEISSADEREIMKLSKKPNIINYFVESIAPHIYGYSEVKEAMVFSLFGGTSFHNDANDRFRGEIHLMFVGDPSTAKTRLATSMKFVSPKIRIASAASTAAGLIGAVIKDEFIGEYVLEAGAMALANGGHLILDEMDKVSEDDIAKLHTSLEQGFCSVDKANIHTILQTNTAVIACANPKYSRFDQYLPIAEQIEFPPTLLTRFDYVIPFKDIPEKERDAQIADIMMKNIVQEGKFESKVSHVLFRKYVAFARQKIRPKITEEAANEIKQHYAEVRASAVRGKGLPITSRQLEILARSSIAAAKARLSPEVKKEDVRRAIRILNFCLQSISMDQETSMVDVDLIGGAVAQSQRNHRDVMMAALKELWPLSKKEGKRGVAVEDWMAYCKDIPESAFERTLDLLSRHGEILENVRGFYQPT